MHLDNSEFRAHEDEVVAQMTERAPLRVPVAFGRDLEANAWGVNRPASPFEFDSGFARRLAERQTLIAKAEACIEAPTSPEDVLIELIDIRSHSGDEMQLRQYLAGRPKEVIDQLCECLGYGSIGGAECHELEERPVTETGPVEPLHNVRTVIRRVNVQRGWMNLQEEVEVSIIVHPVPEPVDPQELRETRSMTREFKRGHRRAKERRSLQLDRRIASGRNSGRKIGYYDIDRTRICERLCTPCSRDAASDCPLDLIAEFD